MRRRSNLLVLLGLASFVLGLVAVYLITDDGDDGGSGSASDRVAVLVATGDLPAGALGDDLIAADQVRVEQVPVDQRSGDALTSPSQLSGTRLTASFVEGEQIRAPGVQSLGGARAEIPAGFEAVAVEIGFVAGGANTIIPGDRVNVFREPGERHRGRGRPRHGHRPAGRPRAAAAHQHARARRAAGRTQPV